MRQDHLHDLIFRDQLATAASQQAKQSDGARTEWHGGGDAELVDSEQPGVIEAEPLKNQIISRPEHLPKLVSAAIRGEPFRPNLALAGPKARALGAPPT